MNSLYRFDQCELRPAERRLLVNGAATPLGARAFDMLVHLVEHRERLVTKQELLDAVWPDLVVEENNLSVQVSALRKVLGPGAIATVAGRGFRFAAEVTPIAGTGEAPATPGMGAGAARVNALPAAEKPAIAVLPFVVLSADPADALLADGLVADVIALLARVPGFLLISRASSFVFRDRAAPLSEVARQLAVRYLVEGSVRADAGRVRVNAQLTDAATGHILWNGDFSSPREAVHDLQDGIARGIITQLQPELTRAEISSVRRQRPDNLDAWAHYHRAVDAIGGRGWSEASLEEALGHLRRAIDADAQFGLARAYHSVLSAIGYGLGLLAWRQGLKQEMMAQADEAVRLDGRSPEVLGYAGCALCDIGLRDRGMELLHEALAIDPSNAQARVALGAALVQAGELDQGVAAMRLGMRISPRDRRIAFWGAALAGYLLAAGRVEEALAEAELAQTRDGQLYLARIAQAAALARLGRLDDALAPLKRARQLRPPLTLDEIGRTQGVRARDELAPLWEQAGG